MALTVRFWNYSKRENSTKTPSNDSSYLYTNVLLKDDCSVVNPVLKIQAPSTINVYIWNYCRITEFNRYYFVNDWEFSAGIWYIYLEVDVLASFKTEIGIQRLYVLRATYNTDDTMAYNQHILDTSYPCTANTPTYNSTAINNPYAIDDGFNLTGTYVVGVINSQANNGAVTYYAFTIAGFQEFCQKLYSYSSGWLDIDVNEISEDLQKALVNPFQYVVSCVYIPVDITDIADVAFVTTSTIYFGWWSVNIYSSARIVNSAMHLDKTLSLNIPRHPRAAQRGNYMNLSPYTTYTLRFYPFGTVDIDTEAVIGYTTLDLYISLDVVTGSAELNIAVNGKNNPIRVLSGQLGVSIPTASIQVDFMSLGTKSTAIAAGASAINQLTSGSGSWWQNTVDKAKNFVGNVRNKNWSAIGQGAKNVLSNVASAAMASKATVESINSQGTGSLFSTQPVTLSGKFLLTTDEDFEHTGRPLCEIRYLNTLKGYILCKDADVNIACSEREKAAIQSYLQSGFYME